MQVSGSETARRPVQSTCFASYMKEGRVREREDKDGARQSPNPRGWERKEEEGLERSPNLKGSERREGDGLGRPPTQEGGRGRKGRSGVPKCPNQRGWEREEVDGDRESPYRGTDECIVKGRQKASLFEVAAEEPSPFSTS